MDKKPSEYPYTPDRFIEHIREAVMYFNDSGNTSCKTFAYIRYISDLNASNFNHDLFSAKTKYFLSKEWEKKKSSSLIIGFPCILMIEYEHQLVSNLSSCFKINETQYRFKLICLDEIKSGKDDVPSSTTRYDPDIYRDTENILLKVLSYLNNVAFCKVVNLDTSVTYGYYNTDLLANQQTNNLILSYQAGTGELSRCTNEFKENIKSLNENITINIEPEVTERRLTGVSIDFKIATARNNQHTFNFDFDSVDLIHGS